MNKDLNTKFEKAYIIASETQLKLPPDIMLKFYGYYKQATKGNDYNQSKSDGIELRNAFKLNAWLQLNHLSEDEAKQHYIKLVNKHLKPKK